MCMVGVLEPRHSWPTKHSSPGRSLIWVSHHLAKFPSELYCRLKLLLNPPSIPFCLHRGQTSLLLFLLPLLSLSLHRHFPKKSLSFYFHLGVCFLEDAKWHIWPPASKLHVLVVGHGKVPACFLLAHHCPSISFLNNVTWSLLVSLIFLSLSHPVESIQSPIADYVGEESFHFRYCFVECECVCACVCVCVGGGGCK